MQKMKQALVIAAAIVLIAVLAIHISNRIKGTGTNSSSSSSSSTAQALVLSCIDYRFVTDTVKLFNRTGLQDDYNKFSLAGASLGYNQTAFPEWRETFDKHIELAKELHDINEIVVMDHMDCGAYRILYDNKNMSREEEYELHRKNLNDFKRAMKQAHPSLKVTTKLMDVDGSVMAQ
jgi:carbonic anhydrase